MKKILTVVTTALLVFTGGTVFADEWYITHEPASSEDFAHEQNVGAKMHQQAVQCLNVFGSRRVAELKKEFSGKLFITFFDPVRNATRLTMASKREAQKQIALAQHGGLELVLYGRHAQQHRRIQGLFQYDATWRAVLVPALTMTQPWFCGVFLHELFHASKDRKRVVEKRQRDTFLNPAWVDEEVRAHEFEREVLSAFTGGQYVHAVKAFIAHERDLRLRDIQATLQRRGFSAFDQLFSPASENEMSIRRAQVLVDATFLFVEKEGGGIEEKREAYISIFKKNRR
ncbi:MAG: hypothetical protein WC217_00120 [Candidatus Paceibacterota bacterium]